MTNLTADESRAHKAASICFVCKKPFNDPKDYKVRHHCHVSGKDICTCHNTCNLKMKLKNHLPAVCHNATNFDHAIIVRGFKQSFITSVDVIPKNTEKYLGFIVNKRIKFMDSCQFLLSSLAKCVDNLKKNWCRQVYIYKKVFSKK
jgi:hypothetical protein